jgi:hypothetical protein
LKMTQEFTKYSGEVSPSRARYTGVATGDHRLRLAVVCLLLTCTRKTATVSAAVYEITG